MYSVLAKDIIKSEIVAHLPLAKKGFQARVALEEIVNAVLYKLKTGVQWHQLPVKSLFDADLLTWQSVYNHYRKWCKTGLSSVDFDGSHTSAIRGGQEAEYQSRKKRKTTNALYLTDRQGLPLAISNPVAGNHNDLYDIEVQFEVVTGTLEQANIPVKDFF